MSTYAGIEGAVKIGSTVVGEVRQWSMEQSANVQDVSTLGGDGYAKKRAGMKSATVEVQCFHDPDNALQNQMSVGASVTLVLQTTTGKVITVPVIIDTVAIDNGGPEGIATRNFTGQSNGAWS